ncbi:hypothetical protein AKJ16_DCAP14038 [Drosera capensis]
MLIDVQSQVEESLSTLPSIDSVAPTNSEVRVDSMVRVDSIPKPSQRTSWTDISEESPHSPVKSVWMERKGTDSEKKKISSGYETSDIQSEMDYWSSAVIGYMVGERMRYDALLGYVKKTCEGKEISKVFIHQEGHLAIRFAKMEDKLEIMNSRWFFGSNPMILWNWDPDFEFSQDIPKLRRVRLSFKSLRACSISKKMEAARATLPSTQLQLQLQFCEVLFNQEKAQLETLKALIEDEFIHLKQLMKKRVRE